MINKVNIDVIIRKRNINRAITNLETNRNIIGITKSFTINKL